jgi:2,2-dialkylglycine decarboxylase (pyruvate)
MGDVSTDGRDKLIRYGGEFLEPVIARAAGSYVYTADGQAILDFTSGQMCSTIGHGHPAIRDALELAASEAIHLFSGMLSQPVLDLAAGLVELMDSSLDRVLLLNTGAESNEAALRVAKLVTGNHEVIGLTGSWHGVTGGAVASTYAAGRRGYGPSMPGTYALTAPNCYRCPIRHCVDKCDLTCLEVGLGLVEAQLVAPPAAVITEPILSAAGIIPLPDGYLARLKGFCEDRGSLLIVDEAQTGLGRSGSMFAYEKQGAVPDVLTLSKTLGGGIPLAATATTAAIEQEAFDRGFMHYTSHVSDPLPARVGIAVLRVVAEEGLVERATVVGARLKQQLEGLKSRHECIGDVRGEGLLLGVELVADRDQRTPDEAMGTAVTARCLELGLNLNIVKFPGLGSVLRIAPPLTVSYEELDLGLTILDQALTECAGSGAR